MNRIIQLLDTLSRRRRSVRSRRNRRRGMSLVEIMVVIAIILTLMSIVGYGVMQVWEDAKIDTTKLTMGGVAEKVQIYSVRNNKAPSTGEGLSAVYTDDAVPKDSWGNDIVYLSPGPSDSPFDLISYGRDGKEGGSGRNADIKLSEVH